MMQDAETLAAFVAWTKAPQPNVEIFTFTKLSNARRALGVIKERIHRHAKIVEADLCHLDSREVEYDLVVMEEISEANEKKKQTAIQKFELSHCDTIEICVECFPLMSQNPPR
jgi:hypothetical protein